ncbi:MAG: serine/threonine-protein kinase [Metallibacterium sp.]
MSTYGLALSSFEESGAAHIAALLRGLRGEATHWRLDDEATADLVLVDADSVWGHMSWLKLVGAGRHAVACSAKATGTGLRDARLSLDLPVQADALARVLEQVRARLGSAPQATTPAQTQAGAGGRRPSTAPITDSAPTVITHTETSAQASVADWLLGGGAVTPLLIESDGRSLLLDPQTDRWYGDSALRPQAPLLTRPLSAACQPAPNALATARAVGGQPLSRLRWFVALTSNPGALPDGARADDRLRLTRWPEIEREFPRHFRIATALMRQPTTLTVIAGQVGVDVADVADFARACQALGILEILPPNA